MSIWIPFLPRLDDLFFFLSFLPQCSQNTKLKVESYCIVLYEHKKGQKVKFLGAMQER